jgi:hypothetical protein
MSSGPEWQRGYLTSLAFSQLVLTVLVLLYYSASRPLFAYTVNVYDYGLAKALNDSNITLYLENGGHYSGEAAVNPYQAYISRHERLNNMVLNPRESSTFTVYQVEEFFLLMLPSCMTMLFVFMAVRAIDSGQLDVNSTYGEHGVRDNMFSEVCFWVLVMMEHYVFYQIMASPVQLTMTLLFAVSVSVILLLFCTIAVNSDSDGISRRFEGILLIILCGLYLFATTNAKIVTSMQATYLAWFGHICLNSVLLVGHMWDNPVLAYTVMNCRCMYAILCCWFNILLHIAI